MAMKMGFMTNKVRKTARPIKTKLGGMLCNPKACLSMENTIKIRMKLVMSMSAAGKKDSAVSARSV
jgi:hypothetical protein